MTPRDALLLSLTVLHWAAFFAILLGGWLLPVRYVPAYLLALAAVLVDWNDPDGRCWMTVLQDALAPDKDDETGGFLSRNTGLSSTVVDQLLHLVLAQAIAVSVVRLCRKRGAMEVFPDSQSKIVVGLLFAAPVLVGLATG